MWQGGPSRHLDAVKRPAAIAARLKRFVCGTKRPQALGFPREPVKIEGMKALTIQQPWAGLIERGAKTVELRSWTTKHRGPLMVCAGARAWSDEAVATLGDGPRGVELVEVDLVDVRPATEADRDASAVGDRVASLDGLFAWVLANPRPVEQRPVRGMPGLFTLPPR